MSVILTVKVTVCVVCVLFKVTVLSLTEKELIFGVSKSLGLSVSTTIVRLTLSEDANPFELRALKLRGWVCVP